MKAIWFILIVALSFLPSLLATAKKSRMASAPVLDDEEESSDGSEDDGFFSFDDEEPEVVEQSPYVAYEAPQPEVQRTPKPAPASVQVEPEELQTRPAFDLRQAVIYQTLLNNRYINAEN